MENEINTWLEDIITAIDEIHLFLPSERNYETFQKDLKGKRAIERNLEIIGEATNRILKVNPNIALTNARKIVDTRNRIAHGYDSVSEAVIWAIIVEDLDKLQVEARNLIIA